MTIFLASSVTPAVAIYLVNLAIAAVLISSCGLLAVLLFSRQSAPVRHAILVSTLVLTLLAPGMTWLACQNGWGQIAAIALADDEAKRPTPAPEAAPEKDPAVRTTPDTSLPDSALPAFPFALKLRKSASQEDTRAITSAPAAPQASAPQSKESPANPPAAVSWRHIAIALAAWVWLLGTLIGAGRVARGFLVLRRFRRSLEVPSLDRLELAAGEAAKVFGIKRLPPIRVSTRAPAPLSLGLVHPLIVLPTHLAEKGDAEQLRAILVHEMAHLVHHHHWIGLMQWLAGIMFWWNPLLHRVNRGILQLREEICDDHVLQSHADGREFARVLVDLAAQLTDLPRIPATLAILETGYSDFQHRITNLLDKERTIVTRMTRKAVFSVMLFGLAILFAVPLAGLRAEQKSNVVNAARRTTAPVIAPTAGTDPRQPAPVATTAPVSAAKRTMRVRVLGPDGKPMQGVKVHASIWTHEPSFKHNRDYASDADGWTTVELPKTLDILRLWTYSPRNPPLFMDWEQKWFDAKKRLPDEFVFRLEKGVTIGGSVKNLEGKPIVGARIGVECYSPSFPEEQQEAMGKRPIVSPHLAEGRDVITDADGRWKLDNAPADKKYKITFNVNHPDYVSDFYFGRMQNDQKVTSEDLRQQKATIVMRRGTLVSGKVTDPNGKPVAGAVVAWGRDPYMDTSSDQMFRHEVHTDVSGVYCLPPMPANGPDLRLTVMAEGWSPDMRVVSYAPKNAPADFQLKPGKHLRLRFVDESGKPVPEVYVSIASWRGGQSLYNTKHPIVLDTRIPEKSDKHGVYEWTWAPEDKVEYSFGKEGYKYESKVIAADGAEHEIRLSTARAGDNDTGELRFKSADEESSENNAEMRLLRFFSFQWRLATVQEELHLTDRQKEQITALFARPEPYLSDPKKRKEATEKSYQRLQVILLPKQLVRAGEIALQAEGTQALYDQDFVKALVITGDQQTELRAIYREAIDALGKKNPSPADPTKLSKEQMRALMEQSAATEKAMFGKFLNLLSRQQRTKYEQMIGKKVDADRLWKESIDAALKEFELEKHKSPATPKPVYSPDKQRGVGQSIAPATAQAVVTAAPAPRSFTTPNTPPLPQDVAKAMMVLLDRPPAAEKDRIAAGLAVLRSCGLGDGSNGYPKERAMRELIRIGKPAASKLTEELDATKRDHDLRDFGFVLRGIGDPRAVPALIRAIPRIAQPTNSDCGYTINNDRELLKFMQENDSTRVFLKEYPELSAVKYPGSDTMFSYGRPINEILPALQKITGENHRWRELAFTNIADVGGSGESAEQNRLKRLEFQKLAVRWADWWDKNWQKFVKDEDEAEIEPTRRVLAKNAEELAQLTPQPMSGFPVGKDVALGGGMSWPSIISFDDPRMMYRSEACIDLDTGRMPLPPDELVKTSSPGTPSPALLSWAEKESVNLIGMKFRPKGSEKSYFAFQPHSMKVWRIDIRRYDHLEEELQKDSKLDLPEPWEGPIASLDEKSGQIDDSHPASFLFLTKRGICGTIRVRSKEAYSTPKAGTPASRVESPFQLQYIYRSDKSK